MESNFSKRVKDVISYSREEAIGLRHNYIGPEHLLLGLIREGEGVAINILVTHNVDLLQLKRSVANAIRKSIVSSIGQDAHLPLTRQCEKVLKITRLEAKLLKSREISDEHLLLSILREENNIAAQILFRFGITYEVVRFEIEKITDPHHQSKPSLSPQSREINLPDRPHKRSKSRTPILDNFVKRHYADEAWREELSLRLDSEQIFDRLTTVLGLYGRRNPVLISDSDLLPDVLVENLAMRINQKQVPRFLRNKVLLNLDIMELENGDDSSVIADRVKAIVSELRNFPDVLLVIDEFQDFFGGKLYQIFEQELARHEMTFGKENVQCICIANQEEYNQLSNTDEKFRDHFQSMVMIPATASRALNSFKDVKSEVGEISLRDKEHVVSRLQELKFVYETYHNVQFDSACFTICVEQLSQLFSSDKLLKKSLELLDETACKVKLENESVPATILDLETKIEAVKKQKNKVVRSQLYEEAAQLRDKEKALLEKLEAANLKWEEEIKDKWHPIFEMDISSVLATLVKSSTNE